MKHAGADALASLEPLLSRLRTQAALAERTPGTLRRRVPGTSEPMPRRAGAPFDERSKAAMTRRRLS
jgi:hypothetical protein